MIGAKARKRHVFETLLVVLWLAGVVLLLWRAGTGGRAVLSGRHVELVSEPRLALAQWEKWKVRGRVLFLFDRYLNAEQRDGPPDADNYVYLGIKNGMVREIYHVVPDGAWDEVSRTLGRSRWAAAPGKTFRLAIEEGAPVVIARLRDIPLTGETALVNLNADLWSEEQLEDIVRMLDEGRLRSDLVTISGRMPGKILREFEAWNEGR